MNLKQKLKKKSSTNNYLAKNIKKNSINDPKKFLSQIKSYKSQNNQNISLNSYMIYLNFDFLNNQIKTKQTFFI